MNFRVIEYGSDDFKQECELRQHVLRVPLGLNLYDEDLAAESSQRHFGLFDDNQRLLGCAIAVFISSGEAKIRQMAVSVAHQGMGLGRQIMLGIEANLAQSGYSHLTLHARLNVAGFYEKLGYQRTGREFVEVGIPHIKMEKRVG